MNFLKKTFFLFFLVIPLLATDCRREDQPFIFSETCVTTRHHDLLIPNLDLYVKYNATNFNFPGFEDVAEYDTTFQSGADAIGCIRNLPFGKHWLVGIGTEEGTELMVKGRAFLELDIAEPEKEFTLYVGEEIEFCQ